MVFADPFFKLTSIFPTTYGQASFHISVKEQEERQLFELFLSSTKIKESETSNGVFVKSLFKMVYCSPKKGPILTKRGKWQKMDSQLQLFEEVKNQGTEKEVHATVSSCHFHHSHLPPLHQAPPVPSNLSCCWYQFAVRE